MLRALVSQLFSRGANAATQYRLGTEARERLDWAAAIRHYESALRTDPHRVEVWNDLGLACCETRDFTRAREAYERAVELQPDYPVANLNLAHLLRQEFLDFPAAEFRYRRALTAEGGRADALCGLGLSLQEQGEVEEAVACYREVIRFDAGNLVAREYLLFALNLLPGQSQQDIFAEHLRWAAAMGSSPVLPRPARRTGGRIRLGFVSGDFRSHSTAGFLLPLLCKLDRARFEVFCYNASLTPDQATESFKRVADCWLEIHASTDEEAAGLICNDRIDILVDLSGHTRGGRPGIFARRPAPVSVTWLGYLNTTGLGPMDFRITDARADPPGQSEAFHTERLIRLPDVQWCFEPPSDAPPVGLRGATAVAAAVPGIIFGSCNHIAKLNDRVLTAWSQLLKQIPDSRLVVLAVPGKAARDRLASSLGEQGVLPARVEFHGRLPRDRYWQVLSGIDVALDPFPYNGGATTCECLWMGVPVISLAGAFGFARSGASILGSIGLAELVADSEEEYVAKAVQLARDRAWLRLLKQTLRDRMLASPLLDAARFARAFEHALLEALERA